MGNKPSCNFDHSFVCFNCGVQICEICVTTSDIYIIHRIRDDSGCRKQPWTCYCACKECRNNLIKTSYYV